jgi:hypothetical protein
MRRGPVVAVSSEEFTWRVTPGSMLRSAESARACLYQKRRSDITRLLGWSAVLSALRIRQ